MEGDRKKMRSVGVENTIVGGEFGRPLDRTSRLCNPAIARESARVLGMLHKGKGSDTRSVTLRWRMAQAHSRYRR